MRHVDVEHPDQHRWERVGENSERSDPVSLIPAGQEESSPEQTEDDRPALSHTNAAEFFPLLYEDDFNPDEVKEDCCKSNNSLPSIDRNRVLIRWMNDNFSMHTRDFQRLL